MRIEEVRSVLNLKSDGTGMRIGISEWGFDEITEYGELAVDFDYKVFKPFPEIINNNRSSHGQLTFTTVRAIWPEAEIHLLPPSGKAVEYAIKNKLHVVSASLKAVNNMDIELERKAAEAGVYLMVSAGNSGDKGESSFAQYHYMWTAVGAVHSIMGRPLTIADYSAWGKGAVDIVSIASVAIPLKGKTFVFPGTSCSCPVAAGMYSEWAVNFEKGVGRLPYRAESNAFLYQACIDMGEFGIDEKTGHGLPIMPDSYRVKPSKQIKLQIGNPI